MHTTLAHLSTPEQFLISAVRLWNQARGDRGACCCRSLLRNGFHAAGLWASAFETFDRVMELIDAARPSHTWIEDPHTQSLSVDEVHYLRVIAQGQQGDLTAALYRWLPPSGARTVRSDFTSFARACAVAGLHLPHRDQGRAPLLPLHPPSARLH